MSLTGCFIRIQSKSIIFYNIIARMQDKSILSQYTRESSDYHSRKQGQMPIIPPLHSGIYSYHLHKHLSKQSRINRSLISFGSSSSRISKEIQPKVESHIISYVPIYQNDQLNNHRYKQVPFLAASQRFKENKSRSPSPNKYYTQSAINITKPRQGDIQFPKVHRQALPIKDQKNSIGPGSYDVSANLGSNSELRGKIKQRYEQTRKKYEQLCLSNRKKEIPLKFGAEKLQTMVTKEEKMPNGQPKKQINDRFAMKKRTQKYMYKQNGYSKPSQHAEDYYRYQHFSPSFVQKRENPFASYIPKNQEVPGPGSYMRQQKSKQGEQGSCVFKSSIVRQLFGGGGNAGGKQKVKLSHIL